MNKIFWENPYQTRLQTQVELVYTNEILFESTIAYSFAGGQESDKYFGVLTALLKCPVVARTLIAT